MDTIERDAWREADRILDVLLDLPRGQQGVALAAMALPQDLQQRVAQLLAVLDGAGPLDQVPGFDPAAVLQVDALTGRQLGRWLLQHEIGRGGMAVVYRAQSVAGPAGQAAAVKVLSLGAVARSGHERLLVEQQALLRLRHPLIAPLYEAGLADDDTPWLAMALVEGQSIDAWCSERGLGVEARVRLVLQVAEALAYAHRNLVIHRDIKPSNVMVDRDGHVRLLDFGIARLSDAVVERTATSMRALTPEYAAPEQLLGAPPSTSMDVYGLGALLYRLLTGVAPRAVLRGGKPVTQPSRCVVAAPGLSASERRQRSRSLRGDLDAVLLKALAERPEERFHSVDALAGDLQRWLGGMPVQAQPPSRAYRLRKFVVRNRIGVAAAALLLLTLGAGIGGILWQSGQARQQAALAHAAQVRSERARARSDAIRDFLFELFRSNAPGRPREQLPTTGELLAEAIGQVPERFKDDPETQAEFLGAISEVYYQRAMPEHLPLRRGVLQLRSAQRQQQPVEYATAQADLAYSLAETEQDESLKLFAEAIDQLQQFAPGSRQLAYAYRQRAALQMHRQDGPARLRDSERAWAIMENLSNISVRERFFSVASVAAGYHQAGEYRLALGFYDKAVALGTDAFDGVHVHAVVNRTNRAGVLSHLGRFSEAEADYRAALADYRRVFDKPRSYMLASQRELELIHYRQGRFAEALQDRDEWDRMLLEAAPDDHAERAKSQVWRARNLVRLQRNEEAAALVDLGLPSFTETGKRARNRLMGLLVRIRIACDTPQPMLPTRELAAALEIASHMEADKQVHGAETHALAGLCALRSGDARLALVHLDRAAVLDARLPPGDAAEVAEHLLWRGQALMALGDIDGANAAWDDARQRMRAPGLARHPLQAALRVVGG